MIQNESKRFGNSRDLPAQPGNIGFNDFFVDHVPDHLRAELALSWHILTKSGRWHNLRKQNLQTKSGQFMNVKPWHSDHWPHLQQKLAKTVSNQQQNRAVVAVE